MVSHIRLENTQNYKQQVCLSVMTGLYGCRWKRYQRSTEPTTKFEKAWVLLVAVCFSFIIMFLYYWVMAQNDLADFNSFIYGELQSWFNWFMLLYILTILTLIYVGILVVLAIAHGITGRQLYLHWVHKVPVVLILASCIIVVIVLTELWKSEWVLVALTLQVTAPVLQIVAVVILTVLAWPLAGLWWRNHQIACRCISLIAYTILLLFVYLSPLIMHPPCVINTVDLPAKPPIIAHRGAEQLAPENTVISYQTAANYSVYGFETDVRISLDGIPFLMHDSTLARTTNVHEVFPNRTDHLSESFTWNELQKLDAGSWFLQRDPLNKLKYVPEKTREKYKQQKIPGFEDFLKLGVLYNKTVVFDVFKPPKGHHFRHNYTQLVVDMILASGIQQEKVWWLHNESRSWVEKKAPGFVQTAEGWLDVDEMLDENITNVNAEFSEVNEDDIRLYAENFITTNIYIINTPALYSIYWCVGTQTITSGACQDLYDIKAPVWHMTPTAFLIVSIVLGVASALCVSAIFIIQRCRHPAREVNPESISLHSPRHFASSTNKKSDRELLYRTNEDTMFSPAHATGKNVQLEEEPPLYQDDLDAIGVSSVAASVNMHQEVKMQLD
ncbi:glycerophosphodiester phosphodiesterase domain-containing protein 5-like isoform X2 [Acanthaster planci]|uniref:Glycerophosphodiester phosphodiesterase domain-containing protein 5-like isoform X2 n=1 Tax=Acanthaster planci TaxID=133434 RepID=A0A8B7Z139_ACAPL|nr:glycerophosphodiester phosphodiesterase domain-containing protein 5-like isoform X2 [Acanthaster planci]